MSWPSKALEEIFVPSGLHRAGARDLPVLSITMRHGLVDQADKFKKRVASSDTSSYRIAYRHELVVGFPIDEGVLGFQQKYEAGIVSPAYDIWRLSQPDTCHIPFLERYLRSDQARHLYASRMQGAVARRRSLPKADFLKLEIPFPSLDDQIRIAHLLGEVEGLIAQRKQHLQQLDDLLKSVFLEMFGDPVRNEKGWETDSLNDHGTFKNGLNFGKGESGVTLSYLGVGDFKSKSRLDNVDNLSTIDLNSEPSSDYLLQDGDLLFVRSNGNPELVGRCMAVYPGKKPVVYSGFCIRLRLDDPSLSGIYVAHLFRSASVRKALLQTGQGANIQNINQKILSDLPIPLPPEDLQATFSEIVGKVEYLEFRYRQSLTDLETLYAALSQSAFNGELDLSRIPLPAVMLEPATMEDATTAAADLEVPDFRLPDLDLPAEELANEAGWLPLLTAWLEAWSAQLGGRAFVLAEFLDAAQSRLAELYPEDDLELGMAAYEQIKDWMFAALDGGTLTQGYDEKTKRITLKAVHA